MAPIQDKCCVRSAAVPAAIARWLGGSLYEQAYPQEQRLAAGTAALRSKP
ncbi:MAG TPA: hypothetical protein VF099_09675 [Ktedonobacterales bacterium]